MKISSLKLQTKTLFFCSTFLHLIGKKRHSTLFSTFIHIGCLILCTMRHSPNIFLKRFSAWYRHICVILYEMHESYVIRHISSHNASFYVKCVTVPYYARWNVRRLRRSCPSSWPRRGPADRSWGCPGWWRLPSAARSVTSSHSRTPKSASCVTCATFWS